MRSVDLQKVKLGYSPLSSTIHLYREGSQEGVALDKRDAIADVQGALIQFMLDGFPDGAKQEVCFGNQWYEIQVKPIDNPTYVKQDEQNKAES